MQTHLIKIGNSKGVRLPKAVLEQARLEGPITLTVTEEGVLLAPDKAVRQGWAEAAQSMAATEQNGTADDKVWHDLDVSDDQDWTW